MLAIIVVLLCAAYCTSESSPKLWGSRIVGKPVGPSDTMSYRCEGKCGALIYTATWMDELTIENGSCVVNDKVWGSPCQVGKGMSSLLCHCTLEAQLNWHELGQFLNA
eukprot:TsM_000341700 transcript=TsM_000341700 gene=TsM_000341700